MFRRHISRLPFKTSETTLELPLTALFTHLQSLTRALRRRLGMGLRRNKSVVMLMSLVLLFLFYLFRKESPSPLNTDSVGSDILPYKLMLLLEQGQHRHRQHIKDNIISKNNYSGKNDLTKEQFTYEDEVDFDEAYADNEDDEEVGEDEEDVLREIAKMEEEEEEEDEEDEEQDGPDLSLAEDGGGRENRIDDQPQLHKLYKAAPVEDSHVCRLLIVAYMRTGSSMTGRILNNNPDIMYWYEPLHSLERYYVTGGNPGSGYRNKTLNEHFKESEMAGGNISAILSCDIKHVYSGVLKDWFMNYCPFSTKPFYQCFANAKTDDEMQQCSANMTRPCLTKYKATAVKSIRLHMARAFDVMTRDPKVKVVHLVRDPRGVLLSRKNIGFADFDQLENEAALLCDKYMEDLKAAPKKGDPLRDRYMLVRYEDIATQPLEFAKRVYTFMGVPLPEVVLEHLKKEMAQVKKIRRCPDCPLTPLNSTEVAQNWRTTMQFQDVQNISHVCSQALQALGYRIKFSSEKELRDLSVSWVKDSFR